MHSEILAALKNDEFEDFIQEKCAVEDSADFIVTRNPNDYVRSRMSVILPDEFLKIARSII